MPPPTDAEIDALLDKRPPLSPGNTLVTWLSAWANAFVVMLVALLASFGTRKMPLEPRLTILVGTGAAGLLLAYGINRWVENWEAHRVGLVQRWKDWWRDVNDLRASLDGAGLSSTVLPTLERLPKVARRWVTSAPTPR